MYKAFAIAVLIAAPLAVLAVQSLVPASIHGQAAKDVQAPAISTVAPAPVVMPVAPPSAASVGPVSSVPDPGSFSQPFAPAGAPVMPAEATPPVQAPPPPPAGPLPVLR